WSEAIPISLVCLGIRQRNPQITEAVEDSKTSLMLASNQEANMGDFTTYVGNSIVVESGVAILGPEDNYPSLDIRGIKFSIRRANDRSIAAIKTKTLARDHVMLRINVWQGDH